MEPLPFAVQIIKFCSLMLWCYALVLIVVWFRAVGAQDFRTHVSHFVALMGVMVPFACILVLVVFLGGILGLPSTVAVLVVLVPAGLVISLQLELSRLVQSDEKIELIRLAATICLAAGIILWRGGV